MSNKTPGELDVEWMERESIKRKLNPPSENSRDAFIQKVGQMMDDKYNNQSESIIRSFVYSTYLWGGLGDMPVMMGEIDVI